MKKEKIDVGGIPAVVWGESSERCLLFVHGRLGSKLDAAVFADIAAAKGWQVVSFDLPRHGERQGDKRLLDVWSGMGDVRCMADWAFARYATVSLCAWSIGAYFSLLSCGDLPFERVLFQSPIVDMAFLIRQMFTWFGVTEERLRQEQEIPTPVEPLSWQYYQYALAHPVSRWTPPTQVLYGGRDNLQSREVMEENCRRLGWGLTVSEESEHPFMAESDAPAVRAFYEKHL